MSNITMYLRVSREDDNKNIESNSISSQRTLITNYIKKDKHLKNFSISEIVDDGYSGTNFDRPGIKKLFEDMKNNKINCVIVKDLSRFGRNYIEVVNYLENIFPFMGVRFISINDNFDTNNSKYNLNSLDINFKNIINEYYSKDLSKKISSAKIELAKTGKWLAKEPFGYKKCTQNKYKLEINKKEAEIVKLIFKLFLETKSCSKVVRELHKNNIPTRNNYRNPDNDNSDNIRMWTPRQIKKILKNKVYIGTVEYLKTIKPIICNKKTINNTPEDIISVEDVHEPIISKEEFYSVQKIFKTRNIDSKNIKKSIFAYKLYCGHCKYTMRKTDLRYICKNKDYDYIENCKDSIIEIEILKSIVLGSIKKLILNLSNKNVGNENKSNIETLNYTLKKISLEKNNNYMLYIDNLITKEEYLIKREYLKNKEQNLKIELSELKCQSYMYINRFEEFKDSKILTQDMVDIFIKRIYVYNKNKIEIEWNKNIFEK